MATLTQEQIDQKMQQLKQLAEEVEALTRELAEAGAIEIPEEDLDKVAGGFHRVQYLHNSLPKKVIPPGELL